jgi:hypothetical protein
MGLQRLLVQRVDERAHAIITPVIFYIMKLRALRSGTLRPSLMTY